MLGHILKKKNLYLHDQRNNAHEPGQTWLATNIDLNE